MFGCNNCDPVISLYLTSIQNEIGTMSRHMYFGVLAKRHDLYKRQMIKFCNSNRSNFDICMHVFIKWKVLMY